MEKDAINIRDNKNIKNKMSVEIQFLGEKGIVLQSIMIDADLIEFDFSMVFDKQWVLYGESKEHFIGYDTMLHTLFIKGVSGLLKLTSFYFTRFPPCGNVFLPFERWPDADYIVKHCKDILLPGDILPRHLQHIRACAELRPYMESFTVSHRKVVEVALSLSFLPTYIILWISDWLPFVAASTEWKKVYLISAILRNILEKKDECCENSVYRQR